MKPDLTQNFMIGVLLDDQVLKIQTIELNFQTKAFVEVGLNYVILKDPMPHRMKLMPLFKK